MKKVTRLLLNDVFILRLIIINSIVIFLQGFNINPIIKQLLLIFDNTITLVFLFEIIVKWRLVGASQFFKSKWNIFDTVLITLAIPSVLLWLTGFNDTHLEYLLVLRISRIFKFFRFIRFLPNINHLILGVRRALQTSVIVLLGFLVYNFVISVVSCYFFRNIAPTYFENPVISFYSIFKIFTVEGWYEIPDYISTNSNETIGALTRLYFMFIVITGGIFGLSLVNSIFVDAMVSDNTDELEKKVDSLERKIDVLLEQHKKQY